ncbi:MAG: chemotaxis-specific protein-glutamate methyltransferase CheB [Bacteroidota bacterium]
MKSKIKVLVVDDSSIMRHLVSDILNEDSDIQVTSTANNGKAAYEKTLVDNPDVIVMDMNMGEYDGLYGVEQIMKNKPTPIIMLSAVGNSDISPIMKALDLGAFDYMNKPVENNIRLKDKRYDLIDKIKSASMANIKVLGENDIIQEVSPHTFSTDLDYIVVVIGSSTGGPTAVEKVLAKLPENLAVPVLIAQHMPEAFIPSFVNRLNGLTPLQVEVGEAGVTPQPRHVYVAPGKKNMIVKKRVDGKIELSFTNRVFKEFNGPSVDALMLSVAEVYGGKTIAAILTGMGRDGTQGIIEISKKGGFTIAQNQESCVVFGMPKEAINSGHIKKVVPIDDIGFFIVNTLS